MMMWLRGRELIASYLRETQWVCKNEPILRDAKVPRNQWRDLCLLIPSEFRFSREQMVTEILVKKVRFRIT